MSEAQREQRTRLGAKAALLGAFAAALVLYATHASMPRNTFTLPGEQELQVLAWAPQAFKFFTRDPQEERTLVYVKDRVGAYQLHGIRGADPKVLFGLDRSGRAVGVELGLAIEGLTKSEFKPCEGDPARCLDRLERTVKVENPSPSPQLCGQIGIVLQKPVPWVWARHGKPITMPSRVLRLEVAC